MLKKRCRYQTNQDPVTCVALGERLSPEEKRVTQFRSGLGSRRQNGDYWGVRRGSQRARAVAKRTHFKGDHTWKS